MLLKKVSRPFLKVMFTRPDLFLAYMNIIGWQAVGCNKSGTGIWLGPKIKHIPKKKKKKHVQPYITLSDAELQMQAPNMNNQNQSHFFFISVYIV